MSVQEFPAVYAAAGRVALVSAVLFVFGAVAGCSSTVSDEDIERGIDHPARDAATISEAQAINLWDEMNRLKMQQDEADVKRSDCLKEAAAYRAKAAAVWSDPSVSEKHRPAVANQYTTLAEECEGKAHRYGQVSEACASRIGLLDAERHNELRRAERYQNMTVPAPDSE